MTKNIRNRILLHACPRCQGDLFPDDEENDFACLQCGRRFASAQIELGAIAAVAAKPELVNAA
jgi:tRNA(Ile2) C34 agmatinyltransferase TiaS